MNNLKNEQEEPEQPEQEEQEYEDVYDYGYGEEGLDIQQQQRSIGDVTRLGVPPYSEAYFRDRYLLRASPYQKEVIGTVLNSSLSLKAKKHLINLIHGYFDPTVFLSNLSTSQTGDKELAEINLDISMLLMTLSYKRTDRLKPELINIESVIKDHLRFVFSRAVGKERERNQQNRFTIGNETEITQKQNTEDGKKEKKREGFF